MYSAFVIIFILARYFISFAFISDSSSRYYYILSLHHFATYSHASKIKLPLSPLLFHFAFISLIIPQRTLSFFFCFITQEAFTSQGLSLGHAIHACRLRSHKSSASHWKRKSKEIGSFSIYIYYSYFLFLLSYHAISRQKYWKCRFSIDRILLFIDLLFFYMPAYIFIYFLWFSFSYSCFLYFSFIFLFDIGSFFTFY